MDCVLNPSAVVDILSKSTGRSDREVKVAQYKEIPAMFHIVLISQFTVDVEHLFRKASGSCKSQRLDSLAAILELPNVGASLPLSSIYEECCCVRKRRRRPLPPRLPFQ